MKKKQFNKLVLNMAYFIRLSKLIGQSSQKQTSHQNKITEADKSLENKITNET